MTLPVMYGIVTTAESWRFVRWTGTLEKPTVEISKSYSCGFGDDTMRQEVLVLSVVTRVLALQANAMKIEVGDVEEEELNDERESRRARIE